MKNQERSDIITKIIFIILLLFSSIKFTYAQEYPEISSDIEIRYRWYKEIEIGEYYPLKDINKEDLIDKSKIIFGDYSLWKDKNCNLSETYYEVSRKIKYKYKRAESVRYVLIENFDYKNNLKIYNKNKEINYKIISNENSKITIDLNQLYLGETLLFYITGAKNYKIGLYTYEDLKKEVISKTIGDETIIIPDKTWITEKSSFVEEFTNQEYENSDLTTLLKKYYECRYREKYVYKYEIEREYYDDNYYVNVEGYIKDTKDFKVYYKGEPITNVVEIIKEKIIKEPQTKYIYIENKNDEQQNEPSNNIKENDSSKEKVCPQIKEKEIEIKEVTKIPKIIYITIFILGMVIILLILKIYKKYVV